MSKKIEELVQEYAEPITNELGLELVDVEFVKEGADWYLRVYIDKPEGVDVEDCRDVSHKLSEIIDAKDPIPQAYYLEVSSPGLERPLKKDKDFEKYQGKLINIKTFASIDGKKSFVGHLVGLKDDGVEIDIKGEKLVIPRDKASSIRLEIEF
jgi:ribosome maturation factor RimP